MRASPFCFSVLSYLALVVATFAPGARASTTVCVTSAAGLDAALRNWGNSSDDVFTIKLQQHTYLLPTSAGFYSGYNGGGTSLRLLGGYYAYSGNPCGKRQLYAPNTTIQGADTNDSSNWFTIIGYGPEVTIEGITFTSFGGSVEVSTDGTATLSEIIVTDMHSPYWPALALTPDSGTEVVLQNSLVYGNKAKGGVLAGDSIADSRSQVTLINNTVAQNTGAGIAVGTSSESTDAQVLGFNNILWHNTDLGLKADYANTQPSFYNTIVDTYHGSIDTGGSLFSHADPQFTGAGTGPLDYNLKTTSPAINVGAPEWEVGGYTSTDLGGGTRVIGSAIDLGAFESIVNDLIPQYVTKTADSTALGTLRTAINTANSNANATTIKFSISSTGVCPQIITLASPLPDITTDVTIDAYSEPGASANSDPSGNNSQICVIVRSGGSIDHALRTSGAGRLTVKGIEFEGFATAAVRLASGSSHQVVGNGFSALPGSPANAIGVLIEGGAKNSIIGWTDPPELNVFDQSSYAAIKIDNNGTAGGHMIEGNKIGFNFDGSNWTGTPNQYGIYLLASGGNKIQSNTIGNGNDNGIRLSGTNTTNNVLTYNTIGLGPYGIGVAAGNRNAGIGIAGGAHNNRIGSAPGSSSGGQNLITNNSGPGVWIESTAGTGNRVTGDNQIYGNSGLLAIDLSTLGPTPNDNGDIDGGANNLQNYPVLTQAMRIEAGTMRISGYLQTQAPGPAQIYRLDLYWTDTCVNGDATGARGEIKRQVGFLNLNTDGTLYFDAFGNTDIVANKSIPSTPPGYVFAIATDAAGNTSEPGPCHTFVDDYIFTDGFGH